MAVDPSNPEYKMGIGGRILGTVANFLSGFGGHGPVVNTGGGAHNWKYNRDVEQDEYQKQKAAEDAKAAAKPPEPLSAPQIPPFSSDINGAPDPMERFDGYGTGPWF